VRTGKAKIAIPRDAVAYHAALSQLVKVSRSLGVVGELRCCLQRESQLNRCFAAVPRAACVNRHLLQAFFHGCNSTERRGKPM
jgi:hypothetical protein